MEGTLTVDSLLGDGLNSLDTAETSGMAVLGKCCWAGVTVPGDGAVTASIDICSSFPASTKHVVGPK